MEQTQEKNIISIHGETREKQKALVIQEVPLTIILNGKEIVTLLTNPDNPKALAIGFLLSEGLIKTQTKIEKIELNEKAGYVNIDLGYDFKIPGDFFKKRLISSGCGRGSYSHNLQDAIDSKPVNSNIRVSLKEIFHLMNEFQRKSSLFKDTGGVHSAALCNQKEIEIFSEDIGRHNAIDKILGEYFLKKIKTEGKIILTTGRVSSEILIKVVKGEIPIIISRSAPTYLAIVLAEKLKLTLIGFARGKRMNIYTHDFRVI